MREQWVELAGNRETYLVSNTGRVKTKDRPGSGGASIRGHELIQRDNSNGYLRVNMHLKNDEKSKDHLVHRIVAQSFVPEVNDKPFVNHKDGNKHNNNADNLEWCDRSENEKHAWRIGLKTDTATKGELHGMHKLSLEDVRYIRKNHVRNGGIYKTGKLAKQFNVSTQTITNIVGNRNWKE